MNRWIGVVAATLMLTACSTVPIETRNNPVGDGDRRPPTSNTSRKTPDQSETRRVFRNQRPAGWLAIDYLDDTQSCPRLKSASTEPTVMEIRRVR